MNQRGKNKNELKEMRTISETSGTMLTPQHSNHRSPRRRQKERPWENTWGDNGDGNNHPSPRNPESPKQDKPKVKHPKTHINQIKKRSNTKNKY